MGVKTRFVTEGRVQLTQAKETQSQQGHDDEVQPIGRAMSALDSFAVTTGGHIVHLRGSYFEQAHHSATLPRGGE